MDLRNGDCLELMKDLEKDSVDLLFADLPYGQTSCKWDCLIDLDLFWKEANRVCKPDTPMVFTCSVKFGNSLINSNPKNFRYDLIWVKSATTGFLNSKKMPLKKHEMVYVFYRKLPKVYTENIALHHTHKFLNSKNGMKGQDDLIYGQSVKQVQNKKYDPPLPNSVIKEDTGVYNKCDHASSKKLVRDTKKEEIDDYKNTQSKNIYGDMIVLEPKNRKKGESIYEPQLPNTILEMKSEKGKHATQKPVSLMEWILKYYSREGSVVLDPTMGSGSMGVACRNINRSFIGIEKDENIYQVAKKRCEL